MTSEVIDSITRRRQAGDMTGTSRYDGTLRVVMWLDAFWSAAATLVSIVGSLAVALLGLPHGAHLAVGITALVAAVFLALCGAVTGVLLMLRMNAGNYTMPRDLRVPLPRGMVPRIGPDT
jgi:hypothetical protein